VMTGGAHVSARRGEGQRWREVRSFPAMEAAIGQGATDALPAGPIERLRPSGERESGQLGKEKGCGPRLDQKPELGPIQVIKPFQIFI
jgi:hypothetical protein